MGESSSALHDVGDNMISQICSSEDGEGETADDTSYAALEHGGRLIRHGHLYKLSRYNRWGRRYLKLYANRVTYGSREGSMRELSLVHCDESSIVSPVTLPRHLILLNGRHAMYCFKIKTGPPSSRTLLTLCASSGEDMHDWMSALRHAVTPSSSGAGEGSHEWTLTSHSRCVFCHECQRPLGGKRWTGLSCDTCRLRVHRSCANTNISCKWTDAASIDVVSCSPSMPHQWRQLNTHALCHVCSGDVDHITDMHCLWCDICVHGACLPLVGEHCSLGTLHKSIIPPTAVLEDGVISLPFTCDPLVVLCNGRAGNGDGLIVMRRMRRALNPLQVVDIALCGGPIATLRRFSSLPSLRVLVCGGDGSVAWVIQACDQLNILHKVAIAVLPLGTGNDLSRVLKWGAVYSANKDTPISSLLPLYESATRRSLDRWSVDVCSCPPPHSLVDIVRQLVDNMDELCITYNAPLWGVLARLADTVHRHLEGRAASKEDVCRVVDALADALNVKADTSVTMTNRWLPHANVTAVCNGTPHSYNVGDISIAHQRRTTHRTAVPLCRSADDLSAVDGEDDGGGRRTTTCSGQLTSMSTTSSACCSPPLAPRTPHPFASLDPCINPSSCACDEETHERFVLNNYFSIGLDAKVALEFHAKRESRPQKTRSRQQLRIMYGLLGAAELFTPTYRNLHRHIRLYCDDVFVELPPLQGLVVLNISSYHGGMNFWGGRAMSSTNHSDVVVEQSFSDGVLEVVAVFDAVHCATSRLQPKLRDNRIAQCSSLRIHITSHIASLAAQVDGEPWQLAPHTKCIRITHHNTVQVLQRGPSAAHASTVEEGVQRIVMLVDQLLPLLPHVDANTRGALQTLRDPNRSQLQVAQAIAVLISFTQSHSGSCPSSTIDRRVAALSHALHAMYAGEYDHSCMSTTEEGPTARKGRRWWWNSKPSIDKPIVQHICK